MSKKDEIRRSYDALPTEDLIIRIYTTEVSNDAFKIGIDELQRREVNLQNEVRRINKERGTTIDVKSRTVTKASTKAIWALVLVAIIIALRMMGANGPLTTIKKVGDRIEGQNAFSPSGSDMDKAKVLSTKDSRSDDKGVNRSPK